MYTKSYVEDTYYNSLIEKILMSIDNTDFGRERLDLECSLEFSHNVNAMQHDPVLNLYTVERDGVDRNLTVENTGV